MGEARGQVLFDAEPDAVLVLSRDGTVREVNPAGLALLQAERPDAVVGTSVYAYVAPEHRDAFRAFAERVCGGEKDTLEVEMVGLKGAARLLGVHAVPLRAEPDGRDGLLAVTRDVTRLRETETALRESRKMAAVGHLAGGFAHDFNNLLNGIMGGLWMVATKLGPDHPATPLVAAAGQAGRRAADLIRQLLTLGRRSKGEARLVELPSLSEDVARRLRVTLDPGIEVVVQADPGAWPVNAHLGELRQALVLLCENARDAMPQGGRLRIEVSNLTKNEGEFVRLVVSDTGTGMDEETAGRVFEPFFTTKPEGKALGLGLTVVQATITRLGGTIAVESEPGRGSRFVVEIPRRVEAAAAPDPVPPQPEVRKGNGEVILVVDDEEILRLVARAALEQAGYKVVEAEDADNAVATFQRERERIAVVVTDVKMPGRSGFDVLADLRKCDPNVRVILCSGSLAEGVKVDLPRLGAKAYLPKPYSASDLVSVVRQVLGATS
ncbi:MAG: PAS domain-containing sensor histidine kinase [Nitrospirae bacterium]|nr:MAG: PAS domain-containing sensor histidine kinase [Nitrospirota bacterium]